MPRTHIDFSKVCSATGTAVGGVLIVGKDPAFLSVLERAYKLAGSEISILLHGETGTGKGFLARAIHQWSDRSSGPLIPLNCGELTESLAESELFGYVEGAFTGALRSRAGLVKQADGGTLFNDELDSLPRNVQAKLLRFTDTGEYRPVGSVHSEKVSVRLISATLGLHPLRETEFLSTKVDVSPEGDVHVQIAEAVFPGLQDQGRPCV